VCGWLGKRNGRTNKPAEGSRRAEFIAVFGKDLDDFASVRRATEGLRVATVYSIRHCLCEFFLYLKEDPDTVIAEFVGCFPHFFLKTKICTVTVFLFFLT
jgi:hypothetical protein